MSVASKRTIVYLLRNDLRIHDNECLHWAHHNADHIIPLYCFDPDHYKGTWHFGFPKTGRHRAKFLTQCVSDLRNSLQQKGSNLIVRNERPVEAISSLLELCKPLAPVKSIVFQKEVTKEETDVERQLKALCTDKSIEMKSFWGASLYHIEDVPFSVGNTPDTYTGFRQRVENKSPIRNLISMPDKLKPLPPVKGKLGDIPTLADLGIQEDKPMDERSAFSCAGGESAALERLDQYLWKSDAVATYKETRNGLIGENYSTKFSPWLASGSLSPRKIYHSIKDYESKRTSNQSTYWVIFELIWRDYFKFVCMKYGDRVFYQSGIMGKRIPWKKDKIMFKKWREGQTGVPFVDANMRELLETGWMSNRGRQNVASFLVKDLRLDWRLGAEWFESMLLDHDVCSNYGNWNYTAGIGNDPRQDRKFNMIKQAMDYDTDGDFVRLWVPELRNLKGSDVHTPWTQPEGRLRAAEVELGQSYPRPMIVAAEWERHFKGGSRGKKDQRPRTQRGQRGIDFYFKSESQKRR